MARALTVDTSFFLDLERERRRGDRGAAHRFLAREPDAGLSLAATVLGELAEAYGDPSHPALWAIRKSLHILPLDEKVALVYAALAREYRGSSTPIGCNDLWIAATSLHHGLPLLTADVERFSQVRGLELVAYR